MTVTVTGLIAVLGWGVDDFETSIREATEEMLDEVVENPRKTGYPRRTVGNT